MREDRKDGRKEDGKKGKAERKRRKTEFSLNSEGRCKNKRDSLASGRANQMCKTI